MEGIAMKTIAIMEHLLLQKPNGKANAKDHVRFLGERLAMWTDGDIVSLLRQAEAIQERILVSKQKMGEEHVARVFSKLVFEGKINAALRFLDTQAARGGVLPLSPENRAKLEALHPNPNPL